MIARYSDRDEVAVEQAAGGRSDLVEHLGLAGRIGVGGLQPAGAEGELEPLIEQSDQLAVGVVDAGADLGERLRDDGVGGGWRHVRRRYQRRRRGVKGPNGLHACLLCNM